MKVVFKHKNGKYLYEFFNGDGSDLTLVKKLEDATLYDTKNFSSIGEILATGENNEDIEMEAKDFTQLQATITLK